MSDSFGSYNGIHGGVNGSKDIDHQHGELKPEQATAGYNHHADVAVLAVALQEDLYVNTPVTLLCPGCYNDIGEWRNGVPERLVRLEQNHCDECDLNLLRHEVLVTLTDNVGNHTTQEIRRFVERFWLAYQWFGPSRGAEKFRNWEHQDRHQFVAEEWGWDERPQCPVCGEEQVDGDRMDADHHHRRTDRVLVVCRECHGYGHNVDPEWGIDSGNNTAGDVQDAKAQKLGFRDGTDLKLARYVRRYLDEHDEDELDERFLLDGGKWRHLAWRLNAYTWRYGTNLEARADELRAVYEAFEEALENGEQTLIASNDGSPSWT